MARLRLCLLAGWACVILACGPQETGKYTTGPDDPALAVTPEDLEAVRQVLSEQEARDIAEGLRQPRRSGELPPDHPPIPSAGFPEAHAGGFDLGFLKGDVPDDWVVEQPDSPMRRAQMRLPRAPGDAADGVLTVIQAAGSVEDNLERWFGQVTQPDGRPTRETARVETVRTSGGLTATWVEATGAVDVSMPGGPRQPPQPNWALAGAIVDSSRGLVFFKAIGPERTLAAHRQALRAFIESLGGPGEEAAVAAAPASAPRAGYSARPAAPPPGDQPQPLDMDVVVGVAPPGWIVEPPASTMRKAQIRLPRAEGDPEDAELVVFYFGPGQGGEVEANLERWYAQFSQPDGRPSREAAVTETLRAGDLPVTFVDLAGTMEPSAMPGGGSTPRRPGWRMLAAIVETPRGNVFIKATGPDRTLSANRGRLLQFILSLEPK